MSINGVVVTWVVATKRRAASTRRGFDSLLMQTFLFLFCVLPSGVSTHSMRRGIKRVVMSPIPAIIHICITGINKTIAKRANGYLAINGTQQHDHP